VKRKRFDIGEPFNKLKTTITLSLEPVERSKRTITATVLTRILRQAQDDGFGWIVRPRPNRCMRLALLVSVLSLLVLAGAVCAQGPFGPPPPGPSGMGPGPGFGPGRVPPPPLPETVPLPPKAQVARATVLAGPELEEAIYRRPQLEGVQAVYIVDFTLPDAGMTAEKVLGFYDTRLQEPAWRPFYRSAKAQDGRLNAAYRGPGGFISVSARPQGATVTTVEGVVSLSSMPLLERLVREQLLKSEPEPPEARKQIAQATKLAGQGKREAARKLLGSVLADYPESDSAYAALARIYKTEGKNANAAEAYRNAIVLSPLNPTYRSEYAALLSQMRDPVNADYELRQAVRLDPWSPIAQTSLGAHYERMGDLKRALECYHHAIVLQRSSPELYMDYGRMLEKLGKRDDAIAAYKDALKLQSSFKPAQNALKRLGR